LRVGGDEITKERRESWSKRELPRADSSAKADVLCAEIATLTTYLSGCPGCESQHRPSLPGLLPSTRSAVSELCIFITSSCRLFTIDEEACNSDEDRTNQPECVRHGLRDEQELVELAHIKRLSAASLHDAWRACTARGARGVETQPGRSAPRWSQDFVVPRPKSGQSNRTNEDRRDPIALCHFCPAHSGMLPTWLVA